MSLLHSNREKWQGEARDSWERAKEKPTVWDQLAPTTHEDLKEDAVFGVDSAPACEQEVKTQPLPRLPDDPFVGFSKAFPAASTRGQWQSSQG